MQIEVRRSDDTIVMYVCCGQIKPNDAFGRQMLMNLEVSILLIFMCRDLAVVAASNPNTSSENFDWGSFFAINMHQSTDDVVAVPRMPPQGAAGDARPGCSPAPLPGKWLATSRCQGHEHHLPPSP